MNLPTTRRCSSAHNIVEFTKKRYREKLNMWTNKEDELDEEYLQDRQVKRKTYAEVEAELPLQMMNMTLSCGRVQGERVQDAAAIQNYTSKRKSANLHEDGEENITWLKRRRILEYLGNKVEAIRITTREESGKSYNSEFVSLPTDTVLLILDKMLEPVDHARFAGVCNDWKYLAIQYNCQMQPWLRILTPMLLILTQSHGSDDPATMLYSVSERKIYRNIKLPVPGDDVIYCGFGYVAKFYELAITLTNPFRNSNDIIRLPSIPSSYLIETQKQGLKIILPSDPTLDRNNCVVLAIKNSELFFIRRGQKLWTSVLFICRAATYYEGRVFAVIDHGRGHVLLSYLVGGDDKNYSRFYDMQIVVAWPDDEHSILSRVVQTYFVTSTKGDLLVVKRFLLQDNKKLIGFKVFKWVASMEKIAEVDSIGDEAIFVGNNHSVCVLASKYTRCQPNSIYYTIDVVVDGERLEDIGIFNLEDGSITQLHDPHNQFQGPAIWVTPSFPVS